jgi:hypothetical protein
VANTNLKLTGLDFEDLKSNFKNYLKRSDSAFKDVDFEGSGINQLIDVLSYNTYLNSFYLNMIASEMFMDSAILRDSIVSHAKELNYVPRSARSSLAKISFTITPSSPIDSLLIPKGTSFTSKIGSNNFTFTTSESTTVLANSTGYINVTNLEVYEGSYISDTFVYNVSETDQRFVLSDPFLDTRSITVIVSENEGANVFVYKRASSFLDQTSNSQIYFLQAAENSQYEILFGDNIVGRKPQNGSVITVEYRSCSGDISNGASVFVLDGPINNQSNVSTITTVQQARGGGLAEPIESIKFNAPRAYQNQDRAITPVDFENLLLSNFPEIQAVSAYGGEDADPPQYGRVFISVDVTGGNGSSQQDKNRFLEFIKARATIGIEPVFIDPEFLYLDIVATIRYNTNVTTMSTGTIDTLVRTAILDYNSVNLENFNRTLRISKLIEQVNKVTPSILGVDLYAHPNKRIRPFSGINYSTTLYFGFALDKFYSLATSSEDYIKSQVKAVYSSKFIFEGSTCTLQDDGTGNLGIYRLNSDETSTFIKNVGSVDYDTGIVRIVNLNVSSYSGSAIHVHVNPVDRDIPATKNTIISISESDIDITIVPVKE